MNTLASFLLIILSIIFLLLGVFSILGYYQFDIPPVVAVFNLPSVAVILGGTFFQVFVSYPLTQIAEAARNFFPWIYSNRFETKSRLAIIETVLRWQESYQTSRQNTWTTIKEKRTDHVERYLIELLETNYKKEDFLGLARTKISSIDHLSARSQRIYSLLAGSSPAFGMLGTILGLLVMFKNFGDDMQLATGMGFALITTLYGIFMSQFVWIPASKRIAQYYLNLKFNYALMTEGLYLIMEEKSPLYIQDYLEAKIYGS
jgi:chemotaxis protein MotA